MSQATAVPADRHGVAWWDRLPKIELHLHLECAMPQWVLQRLGHKYGAALSVDGNRLLRGERRYTDFADFDRVWRCKTGFLREYEDFEFVAEATARHLASQSIRYVEAFFCPGDFASFGLEQQRLIAAVRRGLARVAEIDVVLVIDLARDQGPCRAGQTLRMLQEVRELGVIGVGLGSAGDHPLEAFAEVFATARRLGFHTTAHAGETAGAESVWEAVRALRVERIGHGTRAVEDESLLKHLAARRLPLEICLSSNVATRTVRCLEEHPVRTFFERGIPLSINTDDPVLFGNSLSKEYRLLEERLGFSRAEIGELMVQGIQSSWLPEEEKSRWIRELQKTSPSA